MSNYGRDTLWDTATWAELDEVVAEEAKRVRVGRKLFRTEELGVTTGSESYWVPGAKIETDAEGVSLKDDEAQPLVELSVPFRLTPAQVEAEGTLHLARMLARTAAKNVALAEDHIIFRGMIDQSTAETFGVKLRSATGVTGLEEFAAGATALAFKPQGAGGSDRVMAIVDAVTEGMSELGTAGWSQPYALILGATLYSDASFRSHGDFEKTAADRFGKKLQHCVLSAALESETGLLVSLAGETVTIYTAGEPRVAYAGEGDDGVCRFRVFERIRHVVRQPSCVRLIR